jgi:non-heme chloroperoxidase
MTAIAQRKPTGRVKPHTVGGGGGLRLHVREWGKADGPPPAPPSSSPNSSST